MPLRPVIFWVHMVVGVSTGLIILLMSSTGVLLSYEKETLGGPATASLSKRRPQAAPGCRSMH